MLEISIWRLKKMYSSWDLMRYKKELLRFQFEIHTISHFRERNIYWPRIVWDCSRPVANTKSWYHETIFKHRINFMLYCKISKNSFGMVSFTKFVRLYSGLFRNGLLYNSIFLNTTILWHVKSNVRRFFFMCVKILHILILYVLF